MSIFRHAYQVLKLDKLPLFGKKSKEGYYVDPFSRYYSDIKLNPAWSQSRLIGMYINVKTSNIELGTKVQKKCILCNIST